MSTHEMVVVFMLALGVFLGYKILVNELKDHDLNISTSN
jgi:hypothetical protein